MKYEPRAVTRPKGQAREVPSISTGLKAFQRQTELQPQMNSSHFIVFFLQTCTHPCDTETPACDQNMMSAGSKTHTHTPIAHTHTHLHTQDVRGPELQDLHSVRLLSRCMTCIIRFAKAAFVPFLDAACMHDRKLCIHQVLHCACLHECSKSFRKGKPQDLFGAFFCLCDY